MLKSEFPAANQQWFSDDVSTSGKIADGVRLERLQQLAPNFGYVPEPSKRILVVAPHNCEQAKVELAGLNFQEETGSRYLGSFTGKATERNRQLDRKQRRCLDVQH